MTTAEKLRIIRLWGYTINIRSTPCGSVMATYYWNGKWALTAPLEMEFKNKQAAIEHIYNNVLNGALTDIASIENE